jgi:hypothetical protein
LQRAEKLLAREIVKTGKTFRQTDGVVIVSFTPAALIGRYTLDITPAEGFAINPRARLRHNPFAHLKVPGGSKSYSAVMSKSLHASFGRTKRVPNGALYTLSFTIPEVLDEHPPIASINRQRYVLQGDLDDVVHEEAARLGILPTQLVSACIRFALLDEGGEND